MLYGTKTHIFRNVLHLILQPEVFQCENVSVSTHKASSVSNRYYSKIYRDSGAKILFSFGTYFCLFQTQESMRKDLFSPHHSNRFFLPAIFGTADLCFLSIVASGKKMLMSISKILIFLKKYFFNIYFLFFPRCFFAVLFDDFMFL